MRGAPGQLTPAAPERPQLHPQRGHHGPKARYAATCSGARRSQAMRLRPAPSRAGSAAATRAARDAARRARR
jgi:hypothetical protein